MKDEQNGKEEIKREKSTATASSKTTIKYTFDVAEITLVYY